jgi:phospholipase C
MLDNIKTIVLLMFENRSFDHMLGHLSYDKINTKVNGLTSPLSQFVDQDGTETHNPFRFKADVTLATDIPHEMEFVKTQMDKSPSNGDFLMDGFVKAYRAFTGAPSTPKPDPMGFFRAAQIPITSFLASNYCVCDKWFASIPTSTQPNRTMAFCGDSAIDSTKLQLIPATGNIFDWLTNAGIDRWRVYHDGLSFFTLYNQLWHYVLGDHFKDYESLYSDFKTESDTTFPELILVEPSYQDSPHLGSDQPNDNHPPLAVGFGEEFLRRTYEAVTCNPERWGNTLMIVYYDEHGGFYDHEPPPKIGYQVSGGSRTQFESLGVRIPAILISPWVEKNSVSSLLFDHTSVLQLLAEKFTRGNPYSNTVENRRNAGIQSISAALTAVSDPVAPNPPSAPIFVKSFLGDNVAIAPDGEMAKSFENAALNMMAAEPDLTRQKYPELIQWKDVVEKARINLPTSVAPSPVLKSPKKKKGV